MNTDLEEYYKHVKYIDEKVAIYKDEEGNAVPITPSSLLVACQYQIFNKEKYNNAVFEGLIPKDLICNEIEITKPVPKNEVTGKDSDKFTLVDMKQKVKEVWIVSNSIGIRKAYNNKEQALETFNRINKEIFDICKVEYDI